MRTLILCLLAIIALAAVIVIQPESAKTDAQNNFGMPWQITINNDQSQVFGLALGSDTLAHSPVNGHASTSSTMADAIRVLGSDYELAILAKPDQRGDLELFYPRFRTGPLQGKLIVGIEATEAFINAVKQAPGKQEFLDNGTKKIQLSAVQHQGAMQLPIRSLTLAPSARLNDALLKERFGEPSAIIGVNQQVSHYIYQTLGLAVRVDKKGKDMLHYVSPAAMPELIARLHLEASQGAED